MAVLIADKRKPAVPCDRRPVDIDQIRKEFPLLAKPIRGHRLAYLDNAATTQKPRSVINRLVRYYESENANIHRGIHYLSELATNLHSSARQKVRAFINAAVDCEIVFTRGATEGINLVAQTYGRQHVGPGDEVLISHLEHHSNIVPWQILCNEKGAHLRVVPINDAGELDMDIFAAMITPRTRIVAITHTSNALGTVTPIEEIIRLSHAAGVPVLVDGAQSAPHREIDVQKMGCDFFVFSGHKMYGPTGIGVLYGRADLLTDMDPFQGGGDMILSVTFDETKYNYLPYKFEAGTPDIAGAIGLGAAVDFMRRVGVRRIQEHEEALLDYATVQIQRIPGVHIIGNAKHKAGVLSFTLDYAHPHDIGQILDSHGVAIRAGHHCAQPVMNRFGVPATARASFAVYNGPDDVDQLIEALEDVHKVFG